MHVIFPLVQHSRCVRAMCQRMTVKRKTAAEVDLPDKGQTSQRRLEINGSAGCTPLHSQQPLHSHTHALSAHKSGWSLTQRLTYEEPVGKIKNICDSGTDKHSGVRWKTCKFKASTTSVSSLTTFRANFNSRPSMSLSC